MKLTFITLLLIIASASCLFKSLKVKMTYSGVHQKFEQTLDHFNPQDNRTFVQRYWVDDSLYRKGGPVFIYIPGEASGSGVPGPEFSMYAIAQKAGALMLALENRFYGESQPFGRNVSTANLAYLTVEQALEDIAVFITWFKANSAYNLTESQPWITVGGSYTGALSAWFRYKYPHLTAGAWAASAVVHPILNYDLYDYQIYVSTNRSGPECPLIIQNITDYVEDQLNSDNNATFKAKMWGPNALQYTNQRLLQAVYDVIASQVQYGGRVSLCENLFSYNGWNDLVNNLQDIVGGYLGPAGAIQNATLDSDDDDDVGRQWFYQTCTQVGWFQTADNNTALAIASPSVDLAFYEKSCAEAFGENLIPNIAAFNMEFGGVNLQATNVVLTQSSEDPWQWAGKNTTTGSMTAIYLNCPECGHCTDLYAKGTYDYPSVNEALDKIESLILGFVGYQADKHEKIEV